MLFNFLLVQWPYSIELINWETKYINLFIFYFLCIETNVTKITQ